MQYVLRIKSIQSGILTVDCINQSLFEKLCRFSLAEDGILGFIIIIFLILWPCKRHLLVPNCGLIGILLMINLLIRDYFMHLFGSTSLQISYSIFIGLFSYYCFNCFSHTLELSFIRHVVCKYFPKFLAFPATFLPLWFERKHS